MRRFIYLAKDRDGKQISGTLCAQDNQGVVDFVVDQGYRPVSVKPCKEDIAALKISVDLDNLIRLTQKLSAMLRSGISILVALRMLWKQSQDKNVQIVLSEIITDVGQGFTFSKSIQKFPQVFSNSYVSLAEVGEKGGAFPEALDQVIVQLLRDRDLINKVRSALLYPFIVLIMAVVVVAAMITFVVPTFKNVFDQMQAELPFLTQLLILISDLTLQYWWLGLLLIAGVFFGFWKYGQTPEGAFRLDALKLKIPVVGELIYSIALTRFAHSFHALLESGVNIEQTLLNASKSCANRVMTMQINRASESIIRGKSISASLADTDFFPVFFVEMLAIGEASGTILDMLKILLRFLDDEINYSIHRIFTILGPALIIFVGFIVLFIMVSIYLPIFTLWGVIGV